MSHWQLFSTSFGRMLHPTLWVYGLVIVLAGSAPAVVLLFNNQLLLNLRTATLETMLTSFASLLGVFVMLSVIGFVFATFGDAALIHLINKLELRERASVGMGLDAGEKIFQLLVVRLILILPNILVVFLAFALMWGQVARIDLTTRTNPLAGLFGGACGILLIVFVVNLITSALLVGAERAIVIEKLAIGKALGVSGQLFAAQLGDFIMIGLIFLGLSLLIGLIFSCVGQPLLGFMFSTASPTALRSGSLLTNPIMLLTISIGLIGNILATILVTSVWTLAYREWRADRLPAPPRDDFA
ncbi:hypothetical protein TFLX_04385 [Thermoflexales bacterium]|nr:hypothetical protein TFLX_04385 [Thermoflexales bacterium]